MTISLLLIGSLVCYLSALLLYCLYRPNQIIHTILAILGVLLHLSALIVYTMKAQHPPFTNLYETFLLLPFLIALRLILFKRQLSPFYKGSILTVVVLILTITFLLPGEMKAPKPLMPALNSFWMFIHVPAYFFGYTAMFIGFIYALLLLLGVPRKYSGYTDLAKKLDSEVKIGFFFLTLGLVTGAVWAYVSWGNYWAWDPKETWALINILILSFYFHLNQPTARRKAWVVVFTFLSIIFTYWGVSTILPGLHSYM